MTDNGARKWQELAATSHYQTAVAIADELASGNVPEASAGLGELIEAVARSERRALRSQLIRLMVHVLKWKNQSDKRSAGWAVTILQAREEIAAIQDEVPSLTRLVIEGLWDYCLRTAVRQAAAEIGQPLADTSVSWDEAFTADYTPGPANGAENGVSA